MKPWSTWQSDKLETDDDEWLDDDKRLSAQKKSNGIEDDTNSRMAECRTNSN